MKGAVELDLKIEENGNMNKLAKKVSNNKKL
jgi:hypothetical protein